jgi:hypothetical protein
MSLKLIQQLLVNDAAFDPSPNNQFFSVVMLHLQGKFANPSVAIKVLVGNWASQNLMLWRGRALHEIRHQSLMIRALQIEVRDHGSRWTIVLER